MLNLIVVGSTSHKPVGSETEMDENADSYKDLRLAICSERRRALLLSLNEGTKSLGDLSKELKTSSSALIHALRELEGDHLVRQDQVRRYELTPIGRGAVRKVIDFCRAMEVLQKYQAFWLEHNLRGIPDQIFDRIGSLRDATLITGSPSDLFKAMRHFVELLQNSDVVKLVSPIYIPDIDVILLEKFASEESRIELVLTEEVLNHLISEAEDARFKDARDKYLTLRVLHDDPKLVMVVTDRFMALALYRTNESFDYSSTLTSEKPEAIAWGQQLFDYYVSVSAAVTF